ncbi:MAG: hypothetical protein ACYCYE_05785 [Clostridia bacterium]
MIPMFAKFTRDTPLAIHGYGGLFMGGMQMSKIFSLIGQEINTGIHDIAG